MKFENITIEFDRFMSKDVISASEEVANPTIPTAPEQGQDPYVSDKW